jgi:hypothetical protein
MAIFEWRAVDEEGGWKRILMRRNNEAASQQVGGVEI